MKDLLERYPSLTQCSNKMQQAVYAITDTYKKGGKVLLCGNGGSESDCDHIVGELMKGFMLKRSLSKKDKEAIGDDAIADKLQYAVPAISLPSLSAVLTAYINDVDDKTVYAQLMYGYGQKNDVAIGISTSGNSINVVNAMKAAKAKGLKTIALTGHADSELDKICDITIKAPENVTYKIQELHLPIYHYICAEAERILFGGNEA